MNLKKFISGVSALAIAASAFAAMTVTAGAYHNEAETNALWWVDRVSTSMSEEITAAGASSGRKEPKLYFYTDSNKKTTKNLTEGKYQFSFNATVKGDNKGESGYVKFVGADDKEILSIRSSDWSGTYYLNDINKTQLSTGTTNSSFVVTIDVDNNTYSISANGGNAVIGSYSTDLTYIKSVNIIGQSANNGDTTVSGMTVNKIVPDHATVSVTGGDWYHYVEADDSVASGAPDETNPVGVKINYVTVTPGDYAVTGATVTYTSSTLVPKESGATIVDNGNNISYSYDVSFGTAITAGQATIAILASTSNGAGDKDSMRSSNFKATAIEGSIIE